MRKVLLSDRPFVPRLLLLMAPNGPWEFTLTSQGGSSVRSQPARAMGARVLRSLDHGLGFHHQGTGSKRPSGLPYPPFRADTDCGRQDVSRVPDPFSRNSRSLEVPMRKLVLFTGA